MRYWSILLAKIAIAAPILYGIWLAMHAWYVTPEEISRFGHRPFGHDLTWTTLMFIFHLLLNAMAVAIFLDQKYRCRTCGRRLRMPIRTGNHGHILFSSPKTEYICTYGHGTLQVPEIQFTGKEPDQWKQHDDDIWKELFPAGKDKD